MIANIKSTEGVGSDVLKKTIHAGSESIMFSVLQETQYMYPFKSAVREIVSNSLDSINEKINSLKIINGELKVSDLFIEKKGDEFKESRFEAEYYNTDWLSDSKKVVIKYIQNDTKTRDRIKFIDEGVGLGGSRLINYFSLGFSTKRLNKTQLGSFGLGAKSLLATGVDMYTVTSRYNGREYSFNVFKDHVVSNIDKFGEDGVVNKQEVFYNDFKCYYRDTDAKNGVTVEAEVKRHRKEDYFGGIKNQLGYIDNIEFLVSDENMPYNGEAKRNIASKILYNTNSIIVGESDYYAVPQILLKPGEESNIKINYGPINFDELEMKKYSGNVGFVMNINEVDVTPSRESVIWNSKTRDAIKNMFIKAQKTISKFISKELGTAKGLPDHLYQLDIMKSNTNSGKNRSIAELYKLVDVSEIDVSYRGFNISDCGLQMGDKEIKDHFIFTRTKVESYNYYNKKVADTKYDSALTKRYISKLSPSNQEPVIVFISETKSKGIARYCKEVFGLSDNIENVEVIFIKPSLFDRVKDAIKEAGGYSAYVDIAYNKRNFKNVLLAEVINYTELYPRRILLEKDVDKAKMIKLAKDEEDMAKTAHMTDLEKAKLAGKVIGNYHNTLSSTYRKYYNEDIINTQNLIIYNINDDRIKRLLDSAPYNGLRNFDIVGFSSDNYKRFYKMDSVRLLVNELFKISFGDLEFTDLGLILLNSEHKNKIVDRYKKESRNKSFTVPSALNFLSDQFTGYKQDKPLFKDSVKIGKSKYRRKQMNYLLLDNKDVKCKEWKCPSNK